MPLKLKDVADLKTIVILVGAILGAGGLNMGYFAWADDGKVDDRIARAPAIVELSTKVDRLSEDVKKIDERTEETNEKLSDLTAAIRESNAIVQGHLEREAARGTP